MDLKLTQKDLDRLQYLYENDPVMHYLANRDKVKFNVGDILIKYEKRYDWPSQSETWKVEITNSKNALPRRYVYMYEDQFGVGYVKRLKVTNGELGDELVCLAKVDNTVERFEVDPLFLDSLLMGDGTFDIKTLQNKEKERKKEIIAFNKEAAVYFKKLSEVNKFLLDNFTDGSTIYYHGGNENKDKASDYFMGIMHTQAIKIKSMKEKYIARMSAAVKYNVSQQVINDPQITDTKKYIEIEFDGYYGPETETSFEFLNKYLYSNRPRSIIGE